MSHRVLIIMEQNLYLPYLRIKCEEDPSDKTRICWPHFETDDGWEPMPPPQHDCVLEDWAVELGTEVLDDDVMIELDFLVTEVRWEDGYPFIKVKY